MAQKKHPVLSALGVLCVAGLLLAAAFWVVLHMLGTGTSWVKADSIGVLNVKGPIYQSDIVVSQLVNFRKNDQIKAIVVRINSPGGAVGPTQEIYREIRKTIQVKPVVASVEAIAASGGYYVASAADMIFANPGSITGSIGVLMEFVRVEDLLSKLGVSFEIIKSGDFKDTGSPHRELTDQERELLLELLVDIQNQFVTEVAMGRNLPEDQVRELADGRIFTGSMAKELGLVDQLGNFRDAVDKAKEMAGLDGEVELSYPKPEKTDFWKFIREHLAETILDAIRLVSGSRLEYRWDGTIG